MAKDCNTLNLKHICNELQNVQFKAEEIGVQLGIDHGMINMFKRDGHIFMSVINHWLNGNVAGVPITWDYLVHVLESKHVGEFGLAVDLKKKYCQESVPEKQTAAGGEKSKLALVKKRKARRKQIRQQKIRQQQTKSVINDDSIKRLLGTLIKNMKNGIPSINVPRMDPLMIDDFSLEEDSAVVTCQVDFDSVVVTGLSGIEVLSAKSENDGQEIDISASVARLEATGNYSLEGKALFFIPLDCSGQAVVRVENASVSIHVTLPTQDNPADIEVSFEVEKIEAYFSDLLDGGDVGEVLNQLLNVFGKEIFDVAEPSISREVKKALEKLINEELKELCG